MHVVGSRALHSVAAAPRQCRYRIAHHRPALGATRGFLSSPAWSARPDETNAAGEDKAQPENTSEQNGSTPDIEFAGSETLPASTPPTTSFSSSNANPAPSPAAAEAPAAIAPPAVPTAPTTTGMQASDSLRDAFSSVTGRGRTARNRSQDGMPAVRLPEWFLRNRVRLYKEMPSHSTEDSFKSGLISASRLILPHATQASQPASTPTDDALDMPASTPQERAELQQFFEAWLDGASWDARKVSQALSQLQHGEVDAITRRGMAVGAAASYLIASLAYRSPEAVAADAGGEETPASAEAAAPENTWTDEAQALPTADLDKLDPDSALRMPLLPFGQRSKDAIRQKLQTSSLHFLAREADDAVARGFALDLDAGESLVFRELCSTVAAEFQAISPSKQAKDLKRPVSVLTIMNYKGRSRAVSLLDDVAKALCAHVVHLDAGSVADIVGPYLGQTAYWARGNIAMLGYSAAEKNGRMAVRYLSKSDDDADPSVVLSRIPVAIMKQSGLTARLSVKPYPSEMDGRWDDLKINNVLEEMVRAADKLTSSTAAPAGAPAAAAEPSRVILHIHHFLELSSTSEGIQLLNKLRSIVDRLWQRGRKIVLVGSTSADMNTSQSLLDKAEDLRQEDCHIIPFRAAEGPAMRAMEEQDTFDENMNNIRSMLSALTAGALDPADLNWTTDAASVAAELRASLSSTVYDIHWVYRFATQVLGPHSSWKHACDEPSFVHALRCMQDQDKMWQETAGAQEPYYSPLSVMQSADDAESLAEIRVGGVLKKVQSGEYNEYEKKLLSDLVDAKDIKTTFDDVVCAAETKDSLKALTSLSLIRPEAFLYGVLAAERIPGCLLYGPPGTGKTLMAKAVAKQSGANMLEVSAASINDMWVGNSEKNVQALFSLARKLAPVVIFLDEADALLGARQTRPGRGGHRETINQFLREWDGLTDMKAFIMVATNRPFDLDEAVLRRLPRRILVDLPLQEGRLAILKVMLRDEVLEPSVSLDRLAAETELYSGSDLKNLCVAAAMAAVREEVRAQETHTGPEPFVFPERRVLRRAHFDGALQEIGASISEDMSSLQAIRRFDERYGDKRRKKRRNMGFEVVPNRLHSEEARVRQTPA